MLKITKTVLMCGFIGGCATTPDVTYKYYPVKWSTSVAVTQTIGCNDAKTHAVIVTDAKFSTVYSSNVIKKPFELKIKDLSNTSSDSSITMTFTEDGRLKGINQNSTGQGEAVVKSFTSLLSLFGAAVSAVTGEPKPEIPIPQCTAVEKIGGGKPVTLTYKDTIESNKLNSSKPITPSPASIEDYNLLMPILRTIYINVGEITGLKNEPSYTGDYKDAVALNLQKIGVFDISTTIGSNSTDQNDQIGKTSVFVPMDETYQLPIPKAALFGKQEFNLAINDNGSIASLGYIKSSGSSSALTALGSLVNTQTNATETARLAAESALIAQQQRAVTCKTKPADCK